MTQTLSSPAPALPPAAAVAPLGRTVSVFVLTAVLASGQLYMVIPLLGEMAAGWGVPAGGLTWLVTAFGAGYAAGFLLFGPLSDRYGRRRLLSYGLPIAAVATALVAVSPDPGTAIALRVVQGVAVAMFPPAAMAYLAERVEPRRRMVAITSVTSGFLAAAVLLQVAAQLLGDGLGWRGMFLVSALAFTVAAVAVRAVMLPDPVREITGSFLSAYRAVPVLLAKPALLLRYAATVTVLASFVALYTGLQITGAAGTPDALLALRASGLPSMILVPLLTPWLVKVPALPRAAGALILCALTLVTVGVAAPGAIGLALLLAVYVAGISAGGPALNESVAQLAGESRGTALALFTFALFLGGSIGPQIAALLGDFRTLLYGLAALLAAGAAGILASIRGR
ncbi:MFS transporter [Planobispora rosea]|uniref:MFS transporter n=1 Tax=Planobispora rosea TaxID=35762 RepID=UPI00083B8C9A|nr:MFS transporter [Planobispora rosea]